VGLGTVGLFVPVWPSTIFFILALWSFKRSSRRLEEWLLNHGVVGPTLRDWERGGAIRTRTKRVAVATLWIALMISAVCASAVGLGRAGRLWDRSQRLYPHEALSSWSRIACASRWLG
jgi:uncharacterized membrane protein YbaN (DUF454 family)